MALQVNAILIGLCFFLSLATAFMGAFLFFALRSSDKRPPPLNLPIPRMSAKPSKRRVFVNDDRAAFRAEQKENEKHQLS